MTQPVSRRHFLTSSGAAALLLSAAPSLAEPPAVSLRPVARGEDLRKRFLADADELIAKAKLDGKVGFAVIDTATGAVHESHEPQLGMPPASVAKALTASYALQALGPGHHFVTQVLITGDVSDGIVQGDVILVGGGDPTLDTDGLAALVKSMKAAGVTGATGAFRVYGGALPYTSTIDSGQPPHVGYSPAVSGLNLNYNRVHFEWRRGGSGYSVSMDARSETLRPAIRMARMGVVARDVPIYTYKDAGGRDDWTVARGALGKGGSRWLPVRKPELYAGEAFQAIASAQGIKLPNPSVTDRLPDGRILAQRQSQPLRIILRDMLKWSTNLTAEIVGLSATKARLGQVSSIRQSAAEMNGWAKAHLGLTNIALVDHSGLGGDSRVSAGDMARAMLELRKTSGLKALLKAFPMRDEQRRIIKDHPISVHAKTGTLNFVSGLAGFADLPDGTELAFAIFAADTERREALSMAQRERPQGGVAWNRRAKALQQALIERWGVLYGS